jgi:hypothetical protein
MHHEAGFNDASHKASKRPKLQKDDELTTTAAHSKLAVNV